MFADGSHVNRYLLTWQEVLDAYFTQGETTHVRLSVPFHLTGRHIYLRPSLDEQVLELLFVAEVTVAQG